MALSRVVFYREEGLRTARLALRLKREA